MTAVTETRHRPIVVANTKDMPRDEWLTLRRQGIGGSDAPAILGLDQWKSPLSVYLDKVGDLPLDSGGSEATEWGTRLEGTIAEGALDRLNEDRDTPLLLRRKNFMFAHPQHPWMLASIDRTVHGHEHGPGIMEVKNTGSRAADQWEDGELPDRFYIQLQHYLAVRGWSHGWLAVLVGGNQLRVEHVERDDVLIAGLISVLEEFWQRVLDRRPPPADGSDATTAALKAVYPKAVRETTLLPVETVDLLHARAAAKAAEEDAVTRRQAIENQLALLIGDAESAYVPGIEKPVCTYKTTNRTDLDRKALRAAHPDIAEQFTTTTTYRRWHFPKGVLG